MNNDELVPKSRFKSDKFQGEKQLTLKEKWGIEQKNDLQPFRIIKAEVKNNTQN